MSIFSNSATVLVRKSFSHCEKYVQKQLTITMHALMLQLPFRLKFSHLQIIILSPQLITSCKICSGIRNKKYATSLSVFTKQTQIKKLVIELDLAHEFVHFYRINLHLPGVKSLSPYEYFCRLMSLPKIFYQSQLL